MASTLSILVLTEDQGEQGWPTIDELVRRIVLNVYELTQTQNVHRTRATEKPVVNAMRANMWRSEKAEQRSNRLALIERIATELTMVDHFVVFHFDGDCAYSDPTGSDNARKFEKLLHDITQKLSQPTLARPGVPAKPATEVAPRIEKLLRLVPFYSVEAWLFQNVVVARSHCRCADSCIKERWVTVPGSIDEELKPKEAVCFEGKHNQELATSNFPFADVYKANKSFAKTVDTFRNCAPLTAALKRTISA